MKPNYSKVNIKSDEKAITISIPPTGWEVVTGFVLGLTIVLGGIMVINLFFGETMLASFFLLLGAVLSFIWLQWFLKGNGTEG